MRQTLPGWEELDQHIHLRFARFGYLEQTASSGFEAMAECLVEARAA